MNPWPLDPLNPYDTLNRAANDVFGSQYTPLLSFLEVNVSIKVDKLFHFFRKGLGIFMKSLSTCFLLLKYRVFRETSKLLGFINDGKDLVSYLLPSDDIAVLLFLKKVVSI